MRINRVLSVVSILTAATTFATTPAIIRNNLQVDGIWADAGVNINANLTVDGGAEAKTAIFTGGGNSVTTPALNLPLTGADNSFAFTIGGKTSGTYELGIGFYNAALAPVIFNRAGPLYLAPPNGSPIAPLTTNVNGLGDTTHRWLNIYMTGAVISSVASGSNAITVETNGARIALGTGAMTFLFGDGGTITSGGAPFGVLPLDGGTNSEYVPVVRGNVAIPLAIEEGRGTVTAGVLGVNFNTPFSGSPTYCGCTPIGTMTATGCNAVDAGPVGGAVFGATGLVGEIFWECRGPK